MPMGIGRAAYGGTAAALGVIAIVWAGFAFAWQPIPPDLPGYHILAYAAGGLLILGGIGISGAWAPRLSALAVAIVYALFAAPWAVRVVRFPEMFGTWGGLTEQISLIVAAILIGTEGGSPHRARVVQACLAAYGVCAVVFGFNHFFSLAQTAGMVPPWLPPSAMFWAVATGVFHCAAGVAILLNIKALLAARLLAGMMLVFEALVWLPYLIKSPGTHMIWAGNATDLALAAAALVVAETIAARSSGRAGSGLSMD